MVVSVFKVILKQGYGYDVYVKADDTSYDEKRNILEFWINALRVAMFPIDNIVGYYEIEQTTYTPLEETNESQTM